MTISRSQQGFSLVEVLVAMAIMVVGLLGLAGLQARGIVAQNEAYQRAEALVLLKDMANRIAANRILAKTGLYETGADGDEPVGTGATLACSSPTGVQVDLCAWHQALLGAASGVGTLKGARGCIYEIAVPDTEVAYRVVVAWQGYNRTSPPPPNVRCGEGAYGDNSRHRVATLNVMIPILQ